jgi:hypothetical protein
MAYQRRRTDPPCPSGAATGGEEEYCVHAYYGAGAGPDFVVTLSLASAAGGAREIDVDVPLPSSPGARCT